jgi:hypothetical protein
MYHANTSAVSRSSGGSVCAKSAYIGGNELTNELTGEIHNYTKKQGVEYSEVVLPDCIHATISATELWNKAELAENRKDARVGREWVIGLPSELNQAERLDLAKNLAKDLANRYQVATQLAVHEPNKHGDQRNYHVHILTTTRKLEQDLSLSDKSDIERDRKQCKTLGIATSQEQIIECRERIALRINQSLELANQQKRVSHLSYEARGIDKLATKHLGKSASFLERSGVKTEIGDYNRSAIRFNELKTAIQSIEAPCPTQLHQQTHKNAPEAFKSLTPSLELSAIERAKLYLKSRELAKASAEASQPGPQKALTDHRKAELLAQITSQRSSAQIIEQKRLEREKQLERENAQKQEYQNTLSKGRGWER